MGGRHPSNHDMRAVLSQGLPQVCAIVCSIARICFTQRATVPDGGSFRALGSILQQWSLPPSANHRAFPRPCAGRSEEAANASKRPHHLSDPRPLVTRFACVVRLLCILRRITPPCCNGKLPQPAEKGAHQKVIDLSVHSQNRLNKAVSSTESIRYGKTLTDIRNPSGEI